MIPTLRAAVLLALAAATALVVPAPWPLVLFLSVLAAAAVDGWSVREMPAVVQQIPKLLSRGVPADLELALDSLPGTVELYQPSVPDLRLETQEARLGTLRTSITALRRGNHILPSPAVRRTGFLGLASTRHRVGDDRSVVVYPDMPAAYRLVMSVRTGRTSDDGSRAQGRIGLGTEFESIRDYQPDDDIRQVNWRATARTGRPMSNQFRVDQDREVIVVIDAGRLMAAPLGNATRLDAAVDAATAVALVADEVDDRAGVVAFDRTILRNVRPSRGGGDAVVRAIFDLEPSEHDSNYDAAFSEVGSSKRAFVLVLTDLVDLAAARSLIAGVPLLVRRHAVVVASIIDTGVDEVLATMPRIAADTYRAAVALEVRQERALVKQRLRHAGAAVIDAHHHHFSARCVIAYLTAKSSARL